MTRDWASVVVRAIRTLARSGDVPPELASRALSPADALDDLGLDSIGKTSLLLEIEQELGQKLPDAALAGVVTLGDLAEVARRSAAGEGG